MAVLGLISCGDSPQDSSTYEALKTPSDETSSFQKSSGRGYGDLVEELYSEILSKDSELKKLEDNIDELHKNKNSSTKLFTEYNAKNNSYFSSAENHVSEIQDSLLKNKLKGLVNEQLTKYNSKIAEHKSLSKLIESQQLSISDLQHFLKVTRTLPLIDKYQEEHLPNTKSLKTYAKQQAKTIKTADTLSKK